MAKKNFFETEAGCSDGSGDESDDYSVTSSDANFIDNEDHPPTPGPPPRLESLHEDSDDGIEYMGRQRSSSLDSLLEFDELSDDESTIVVSSTPVLGKRVIEDDYSDRPLYKRACEILDKPKLKRTTAVRCPSLDLTGVNTARGTRLPTPRPAPVARCIDVPSRTPVPLAPPARTPVQRGEGSQCSDISSVTLGAGDTTVCDDAASQSSTHTFAWEELAEAVDNGKRTRRFCMTLNNPTDEEVEAFEERFDFTKYRMYGKENFDTAGKTPHLQCYIECKTLATIRGMQKKLTTAQGFPSRYSVFACKGTPRQNYEYCSKDGDFWDCGNPPDVRKQGRRTDLHKVEDDIKAGKSLHDVVANNMVSFMKYPSGIKQAAAIFNSVKRSELTKGYWCFGTTGTGKSRWAHSLSPDSTYVKDSGNHWWCGYRQEETVIMDDYRPNATWTFSKLLQLCDFYPLPIQNKGGDHQFNSKRVIITTPHDIETTFAHLDFMKEGDKAQLKRRFQELEFGPGKLSHLLRLDQLPEHPHESGAADSRVTTVDGVELQPQQISDPEPLRFAGADQPNRE